MSANNKAARGYGQYCPLALAAELLCRRWTILIVSRLIDGCTTFGKIHEGVPRISPALLSTRLSELEHAGLLRRERDSTGNRFTYRLTEAGRDLENIVMQMAVWGQHWAREMRLDDLDIGFLAWSMHLRIDTGKMPPGRTVILFDFSGAPSDVKRFWIVNTDGKVDMCLKHPGFASDLLVEADLRRFVEAWRGFRDLREEIRTRHIRLTGPRELKDAFPDWLMLSMLAPYERKMPGRERTLSDRSVHDKVS
ncbi:MAG TPA: helix-turn-helix domain-containing protein [Woeseiaceae bacterium]|nr:helix-turn-helix domain-containing protein [Woeseiaceae bacterium]